MKSYTDLEQSKELAEFLPIDSADMFYWCADHYPKEYWIIEVGTLDDNYECICAWSLAALLDVLPFPQLSKDKLGSGKVGWMVSVYPDNCRYDSCWHDNPIDACVDMICWLHENKLI